MRIHSRISYRGCSFEYLEETKNGFILKPIGAGAKNLPNLLIDKSQKQYMKPYDESIK